MGARSSGNGVRSALGVAVALLVAGAAWAGGVKLVEVKSDPPVASGKQVWSFRMTPSETREYEQIVFECVLRQEYDRRGSDGSVRRMRVEPASFIHREKNVKMVTDLDRHISFWVPLGMADIQQAYGKMFQTNAPVTIARFRITAIADGKEAWTVEMPTSGTKQFD